MKKAWCGVEWCVWMPFVVVEFHLVLSSENNGFGDEIDAMELGWCNMCFRECGGFNLIWSDMMWYDMMWFDLIGTTNDFVRLCCEIDGYVPYMCICNILWGKVGGEWIDRMWMWMRRYQVWVDGFVVLCMYVYTYLSYGFYIRVFMGGHEDVVIIWSKEWLSC